MNNNNNQFKPLGQTNYGFNNNNTNNTTGGIKFNIGG